ncbi:MAG: folylpolyglutamate synthase/dihydrofolate synthase family protein [Myxococcota bacterium]
MTRILPGLYALSAKGMKLGIERPREGLKRLGNPENKFPVVLVTGTNGKGSVAANLSAILTAAGYKTGLFTSPHLVRYNERVRIGGQDISDKDVERLLTQIGETIYFDFRSGKPTNNKRYLPLTFFEVTTALALLAFKEAKVDIAVLEIGLGGRLDATNATEPIFTLITPIGYDHTSILGESLKDIAGEKAMTMRRGRPALIAPMPNEARKRLLEMGAEIGAELFELENHWKNASESEIFSVSFDGEEAGGLSTILAGEYQKQNAAQSAAGALILKHRLNFGKISKESIREGLRTVRWRGRAEWIDDSPPWIIDGSHNREGMREFAKFLAECKKRRSIKRAGLIFASTRAGFLDEILKMLAPSFVDIVCTQSSSERSLPSQEIYNTAIKYFPKCAYVREIKSAVELLKERNPDLDLIVITGSLYLAGNAIALREAPHLLDNPFPNA